MSTQNTTQTTSPRSWPGAPKPLELLVDVLSGKRSPKYDGETRTFTVNVPVSDALLLEAILANITGISHNELVCHLLDFALQEVRENLPEDVNEKILEIVSVQMDSSDDKLLKFK